MSVGQRISERLSLLGISQAELARRVGMAQSSVNALINRGKIGSKHLHKIARELQTTPEYLSGETDDPSPGAAAPQLSAEDRAVLETLRAMSPANRAAVMQMMKALSGKLAD